MDLDRIVVTTFLPHYPFKKFIALQEMFRELRREQKVPQLLIFATHPPCFSLGIEDNYHPQKNFKVELALIGSGISCNRIPVVKAFRGGAVTYHGPEILGCYTVFGHLPQDVAGCFLLYHNVVKHFLAPWGIEAGTRGGRDLWIGNNKVMSAAINYRTGARLVSFGFNLNLGGDLTPFNLIYPCGVRDESLGVTSLEQELGHPLSPAWVAKRLGSIINSLLPDLQFFELDQCSFFGNIMPLLPRGLFLFGQAKILKGQGLYVLLEKFEEVRRCARVTISVVKREDRPKVPEIT